MKNITIDGIEYRPVTASGNRAVVVVDRGWIFAGDVTRQNGRIRISRALHVYRWEDIGLSGVIDQPKSEKVDIRQIADVDLPEGAEIFCVPVADNWGL